ncbi:collagen-like protein [Dysgonomonas sp. Marseille-P4677]|uniref:collagen-like protein n=1 Tax=Dysgonomonas sp. Marseille-P4677 TaxID=2364790 RepID=UPI001913C28F|nr:collagen-like protein [Dysgonomonas sp. Marseille-P4677]MBK5719859.1 collagen-like protein [Dysgonomonas sp. Marseille-P4677]
MKKQNILMVIILLILSGVILSCSEESMQGPVGVKGPRGDVGEKGDKGQTGEGTALVLKYSLSLDKGATKWADGDWSGVLTGIGNGGVSYVIKDSDFGGLSLNSTNHLVVAYARPEGVVNYSQKKMLPYIFGVNNTYGIKIELLANRGNYGNIFMSRSNANGWDNVNLNWGIAPQKVYIDIFFIETRNPEGVEATSFRNYEELNNFYINQMN